MIARIAAVIVVLSLFACGVKNELDPPPGAIQQKGERDPSKPPSPLGQ